MMKASLAAACAMALLLPPAARAQQTLDTWDKYVSFLGTACILDELGLRSKMTAGMMAQYGAGMTEHEDRDGMDFHDHPNGTTLQLSASDEEVYCRVTIPATALDAEGFASLESDLDEQIGYLPAERGLEVEESETGTEWSYDGTKSNRITVRYSDGADGGAVVESWSRLKP
ncbi:hypothetical protein [Oceanicola sp. S124]|uniref:hypothetical protein n=1 Tax=Oceanicola sp. S124 TaxID=1042378 RepID=UPI00025584F1|nr:hypothetical protein [Oceanicola sp. S124]